MYVGKYVICQLYVFTKLHSYTPTYYKRIQLYTYTRIHMYIHNRRWINMDEQQRMDKRRGGWATYRKWRNKSRANRKETALAENGGYRGAGVGGWVVGGGWSPFRRGMPSEFVGINWHKFTLKATQHLTPWLGGALSVMVFRSGTCISSSGKRRMTNIIRGGW